MLTLTGPGGCGKTRLVLDTRGFVADLLAATTEPRILLTSRSPLHVSWEQEFPVSPLRVAVRGSEVPAVSLAGCESVQLFAVRAAASVPGSAVARRLDRCESGVGEGRARHC
jgi:predicted ATPase